MRSHAPSAAKPSMSGGPARRSPAERAHVPAREAPLSDLATRGVVGRVERHHALDEQIRCDPVAVRLGDASGSKLPTLENVAKSVIQRSTSSRRETIHRAIGS